MKKLGIIGLLLVALWGCTTQKDLVKITNIESKTGSDSLSYELVVFDPYFETWFLTNYSPAKDHSNDYYQNWNYQYVTDWNYHFSLGHHPAIFENYIDYDYNTNYGIDLNRKLYYYFRYVETYLKVPILMVGKKLST